ncbi:MAG: hypothetical protein ACFE0R_09425 [Salinarimonas sp.]
MSTSRDHAPRRLFAGSTTAGVALGALMQAALAAAPAQAFQQNFAPQMQVPQVQPTPNVPPPVITAPQVRPQVRPEVRIPRITLPQVVIETGVRERLRAPAASASAEREDAPQTAREAARQTATTRARLPRAASVAEHRRPARASAAHDLAAAPLPPSRPHLVAVAPPARPADLDRALAEAAQARHMAEAREAAEAALVAPVAVEAADLGGFGDPLARDSGPDGPSAAERAAARRWDAMRGRDTGIDALGLVTDLGLPSNRREGSEPPGLRPDPTRLPTDGFAAQDGGSDVVSRTQRTEGDTVVTKTVYEGGAVDVTKATVDGDGAMLQTVRTDGAGDMVYDFVQIQSRGGAMRETTRFPDGTRYVRDRNARGEVIRDETIPPFDRLLTGEEQGGGGWCPPSGFGCSAPLGAAEALAGAGTRVLPLREVDPTGAGPRLRLDPMSVLGNPNPDAYARGSGGGPSARAFDGGKLVNPGDPD